MTVKLQSILGRFLICSPFCNGKTFPLLSLQNISWNQWTSKFDQQHYYLILCSNNWFHENMLWALSKTFNFWTHNVEILMPPFYCKISQSKVNFFSKKLIWRNFCNKIVANHGRKNSIISTVCLSHLKILREINLQHSFYSSIDLTKNCWFCWRND